MGLSKRVGSILPGGFLEWRDDGIGAGVVLDKSIFYSNLVLVIANDLGGHFSDGGKKIRVSP
jgi:hypothetical protein